MMTRSDTLLKFKSNREFFFQKILAHVHNIFSKNCFFQYSSLLRICKPRDQYQATLPSDQNLARGVAYV